MVSEVGRSTCAGASSVVTTAEVQVMSLQCAIFRSLRKEPSAAL
jgi:hypothetical protein